MRESFGSVDQLTMPGAITGLDFTNDGKYWAVSFYPPGKVPCVRLYRTKDNELESEHGESAEAALGVAFANGRDLWYLEHAAGGAGIVGRLVQVLPEGNKKWGVWSSTMTKRLTRDRVGRLLGVGGETFIVWDAQDCRLLDAVVADVEKASEVCQGWFSPDPERLFLYGKTKGKIVLYDWREQEEVGEWTAPHEFGDYITCSPSGRYLLAQGRSARGMSVYDLKEDKVVTTSFLLDKLKTSRWPVFSHDESLMVTSNLDRVRGYRIPSFEHFEGPALAGQRTSAVASARDAPVMAFGFDDGTVSILH